MMGAGFLNGEDESVKTMTRTAVASGLAALLVAGTGVGSAGAATGSVAGSSTVTTVTGKKTGTGTNSVDVITCKITTHLPHYSHHADADNRHMVNVTATTTCTKKVARLSIRVALYKNGNLYKQSSVKSNTGRNKIGQNAARRCVKKQKYTGYSKGVVTFPAGYTPHTKTVRDESKSVTINACKKK